MNRWTERILVVAITVGITAACDPLATNNKSVTVASISDLGIPSPSVVVGEIMRDSLGVEAPLSLTAYDPEGRVILNQVIFINVQDQSIHVDQFGFVHGLTRDTVGARVVAGAGALETPISRIIVSVKPELATKGSAPTAINFTAGTDTTDKSNWSPPLVLTLTDAASTTGAQGFIVNYSIIRSPVTRTAGVPTVYIADDAGRATFRDTTDFTGAASRRVVLRQSALPLVGLEDGTATDTIVIRATTMYAGANIPGSPIDYIIPVKKTP